VAVELVVTRILSCENWAKPLLIIVTIRRRLKVYADEQRKETEVSFPSADCSLSSSVCAVRC